eukprot:jgi/Chlat1/1784/Chrsp134S02105
MAQLNTARGQGVELQGDRLSGPGGEGDRFSADPDAGGDRYRSLEEQGIRPIQESEGAAKDKPESAAYTSTAGGDYGTADTGIGGAGAVTGQAYPGNVGGDTSGDAAAAYGTTAGSAGPPPGKSTGRVSMEGPGAGDNEARAAATAYGTIASDDSSS